MYILSVKMYILGTNILGAANMYILDTICPF